jgi:hypothetical protein
MPAIPLPDSGQGGRIGKAIAHHEGKKEAQVSGSGLQSLPGLRTAARLYQKVRPLSYMLQEFRFPGKAPGGREIELVAFTPTASGR